MLVGSYPGTSLSSPSRELSISQMTGT